MKKLLFVALAAVGFTACVQNEELAVSNDKSAIAFDTFVENATKATAYDNSNLTSFNVYGTISQNGAVVTNIFDGVEVTNDGSGWKYSPEYTQYWIPGFRYDFVAVVDGNVVKNSHNMPESIEVDMTEQEDVLYAATGRDFGANDTAAKVDFTFNHILAKAKFTVKNTIANGTGFVYNIESIKIKNADKNGAYDVATGVWAATDTYSADFGVAASLAMGSNSVSGADVYLLPNANKDLDIEVVYNLTYNGATLKSETKALAAVLNIEQGKAYNFVVEFGNPGEEIEFQATVNDWNSAVDFTNYLKDVELNGQVLPGLGKDESTPDVVYVTANEGLASLSALVAVDGMAGQTVKLLTDVDLTNVKTMGDSFAPIGSTGERDGRNRLICEAFKGTFDGRGHTIKGIFQSGWDMGYDYYNYGSIGLFSNLEGGTVKNLVIEGFNAEIERGDISFIAGSATGTCVFENIVIKNSSIGTYDNGNGGIIGWSGAGHYTFKNITLEETVVIGGLWGSFDQSCGGIVGQAEPGATYNFENVTISCRLDVFNDVTASWQYYLYRMCGMIIGRCEETTTINGSNYPDLSKYNMTFNNVVVNYGDWMNYHYCHGPYGQKGTAGRVEAGIAYGGIDINATDHSANCREHMQLIPFDQLIGGDQIGVRGLREVAGVTVNYPASYRREVASAAALTEALGKGVSVILDADIDFGSTQLAITGENQVVDLGGHALTTANNWGGISLKNGASIVNGTITHSGNTAAIKAFNGSSVENVTINATCATADKTVTGIAVQQGANVESIKNVTINGVSQGIEVGYQATVGLIENAVVNEANNGTAKGVALVINGGKVGKAKDCTFKGETYGVTMHLKGVFAVGLELENCQVEGTTASIYAWDEKGVSNTSGSLNLTYDAATTLTGPFVWDFEDECQSVVTLNRPQ